MSELITAIGLLFVVEGLLYAAFPSFARRMAQEVLSLADSNLRTFGAAALCFGVLLVWLVRG